MKYRFVFTQEIEVEAENILAARNALKYAHVSGIAIVAMQLSPSDNKWRTRTAFIDKPTITRKP